MTVIERAIESAKCRIYRIEATNGQSKPHQEKAKNQIELMNVTIEALEKQIPKKVIVEDDGDSLLCPSCGLELMGSITDPDHDPHYCFECGQALKWGEEDD